jgi:hypothetical protein
VILVAIVGLRVEVLKLGSSVGRQLQQATTLQSSNAVLRSQVSKLSGNQRIEQLAQTYGMVMPGPMDIHFVKASSASHLGATIKGIQEPDRSDFLSSVASERQADGDSTIAAAESSAVGVLATGVSGSTDAAVSDGATSTSDSSTPSYSTSDSTSSSTETEDTGATGGTSADGTTSGADVPSDDASSGTTSASDDTASSTSSDTATATDTGSGDSVSSTSETTPPAGPATGGASLAG